MEGGALDTSQRSGEAAPQGERGGGRHGGVLSNDILPIQGV